MVRIVWIDATKGYAISLVVFGHVLGGAMTRGWLSHSDAPKLIYDYIYSFHMPLFFLISGAVAIDGIRADPGRAFLSRVGSVAWPYVLWGILSIFFLGPLMSHLMLNTAHDFGFYEPLKRLLLGQSSWFLWTLFLGQCVLILALQIMSVQMILAFSVIAFLVLVIKDLDSLNPLIHFMPFLALGAVIGCKIGMIKCRTTVASVAIGALLFIALFVVVFFHITEIPIISLSCGIIGSIASLMIAQSFGATGPNLLMAKCGNASLVVFLLHPYFQGATRELVLWAIGPSIWWQLTVPTVAGVVGPTLIWLGAERLGLQWLFRLDLPSWLRDANVRKADREVGG